MEDTGYLGTIWGGLMTTASGLMLFSLTRQAKHRDDDRAEIRSVGRELAAFKTKVAEDYASKHDIALLHEDMREIKTDIKTLLAKGAK